MAKDFNRAQEELVNMADRRILARGGIQTTSRAGKTSDGSVGDINKRLDELRAIRANLSHDTDAQKILKTCNIMDSQGHIADEDWNKIVELAGNVTVQQERENDTYTANMQQPRTGNMSPKTIPNGNNRQGSSNRSGAVDLNAKQNEQNSKTPAPMIFRHPGEDDPNQIAVPKKGKDGKPLPGIEYRSITEVEDKHLTKYISDYSKSSLKPTTLQQQRYTNVIADLEKRRKQEDKDKPCVIS